MLGGTQRIFVGTSAAAPEVVNLAAKLIAANPELRPPQVIDLITRGALRDTHSQLPLLESETVGSSPPRRPLSLDPKAKYTESFSYIYIHRTKTGDGESLYPAITSRMLTFFRRSSLPIFMLCLCAPVDVLPGSYGNGAGRGARPVRQRWFRLQRSL